MKPAPLEIANNPTSTELHPVPTAYRSSADAVDIGIYLAHSGYVLAKSLTGNSTQNVFSVIESKRFRVAKQVVRSLKKDVEYLELYLKLAQGSISKVEFKAKAKSFLVEPRRISPEELRNEALVVFELTESESMDAQELSSLLGTELTETDLTLRNCDTLAAAF